MCAVDISVSYSAVISFSLFTAAVWCGWACGSGWRGECCADRICQARAAGPGNHQKTVLLGCWRPGTHQCLYWWACCPGGYEGNVISHFILAWMQWDEWGTFCVRLFFHGLLYITFFFSSGLHREVYAHHAVAVFWCCGVLTWGWGCCSDRGRVCTCECFLYRCLFIRFSICFMLMEMHAFHLKEYWLIAKSNLFICFL